MKESRKLLWPIKTPVNGVFMGHECCEAIETPLTHTHEKLVFFLSMAFLYTIKKS